MVYENEVWNVFWGENMKNEEKRNKYANLMGKLKKATNNEYYYEAIFIEYAILEDRTESMLKHARIKYKDNKDRSFKISKKLNMLKDRKEFQDKYIKKHMNNDLLEKIYNWKNKRDKLMHDIVNLEYENEDIKNIALEGECLVIRLNNKSKLINNFLDKQLEDR